MKPQTPDAWNDAQTVGDQLICNLLQAALNRHLPEAESKIWHAHPVWFLDGNPVAGYSRLKSCVRLMFWSGQSFSTPGLEPDGSFKAASVRYTGVSQIDEGLLALWAGEARGIQWDYGNIVKRKGELIRLK